MCVAVGLHVGEGTAEVTLGQSADSGLCWQRVCPREESAQLQLRDTLEFSVRLAAEAGFLDMALLALFYFWQPQTKLILDVLPPCQGA